MWREFGDSFSTYCRDFSPFDRDFWPAINFVSKFTGILVQYGHAISTVTTATDNDWKNQQQLHAEAENLGKITDK